MKLTEQQIKQLDKMSISPTHFNKQLKRFKSGFPNIQLDRAAVIGDGILRLDTTQEDLYISKFEKSVHYKSVVKFVPASGAATRMFKFLHKFLQEFDSKNQTVNAYINRSKARNLFSFFVGLEKLPFYNLVIQKMDENNPKWKDLKDDERKYLFVKTLIQNHGGLDYGAFPKGLIPFHKYKDHTATAFEEHLFEAAIYASPKRKSKLHFTISPERSPHFKEEYERIVSIVERKTNVSFNVVFSSQSRKTDTVAVHNNNEPYTKDDGSLLMRPAGHGALLNNLNAIDADIVFIKNIDNVTVSSLEQKVARYKKILGGITLELQHIVFNFLIDLKSDIDFKSIEDDICQFMTTRLSFEFPTHYNKYSKNSKREFLIEKLDRPIRVCGMVENEGEPGGGPFWVRDKNNNVSLQIVESSQIDKKDKGQKEISKNATHFNPVDLVCAIKRYDGSAFDLQDYVDNDTGFITEKSYGGDSIKALELPGLWNGSMSKWNTVFVEVPLLTFNPVKTVNDLLKPAHQLHL